MKTRTLKRARPLEQTARPTKTEASMRALLGSLPEGSARHRVLACAIGFKRSWVELAAHLSNVQRTGEFKGWGYRTFEAYAQSELFLRRDTAQKLTRSYDFLSAHEPELLDARARRPLPMFESIDALAHARDQHLSDRDYRELRDRVFGEDLTPTQVRAAIKEKLPAAADHDPIGRLRRALQLTERLHGLLLEEDGLETLAKVVEQVVRALRKLVDE